jgi:hypothetical protein
MAVGRTAARFYARSFPIFSDRPFSRYKEAMGGVRSRHEQAPARLNKETL